MADDLLARARALINASDAVANVHVLPPIDRNMHVPTQHASPPRKEPTRVQMDPGIPTDFRCAVFKGSSLITTFKDIRKFAPRGSHIIIDGIRCKVKTEGDYSANRIELAEDYPGETNMEAVVQSASMKKDGKKKQPKSNNAVPIPKEAFAGALAGLEDVSAYVNNLQTKGAKKVPMQPPLKMKKKPASLQPGYQMPSSQPKLEYDMYSDPPHQQYSQSVAGPASPGSSQGSPHSPVSSPKLSKKLSSPDPLISNPVYQELQNQELYGPVAQEQRRIEMNNRMVEKGQSKAIERVEEYNRRVDGGELEGYTEYHGKPSAHEDFKNYPSYVEQQRKMALARVKLQRQREDSEIMRKLEEEAAQKKAYKEEMDRKAKALRIKTEARVTELKRMKKQKVLEEKRRAQEEEEARRERATDEAANAERIRRIEQCRAETEARILRRDKQLQQKQLIQQHQYDWKLKKVSAVKQREVPTSVLIHQRKSGISSSPIKEDFDEMPEKLPPLNDSTTLRSKSEQSIKRTPRKVQKKVDHRSQGQNQQGRRSKPTSKRQDSTILPSLGVQPSPQQKPSSQGGSRVMIETQVNEGVSLPPQKTEDQRPREQDAHVQAHGSPKLSYEEQQQLYFGRPSYVPVPAEAREAYAPRGRTHIIVNQDDDDDDDDFLDDDSLSENAAITQASKDKKLKAREPYKEDPIVMGYDDDDGPQQGGRKKGNSVASSGYGSSAKRESRIPKRIPKSKDSSREGTNAEVGRSPIHTVVTMSRHDMDDAVNDLISDVSSQEGRPQKKNIGLSPPRINSAKRPVVDDSSALTPSTPPTNGKRRRPKKEVWKMAPIPIRPYIAVSNQNDKFKG